jgi:hypothetical protein
MYIHRVARMVRKQIYLSVEQNEQLHRTAARQRRSEAEVLRDALDRHLERRSRKRRRLNDDPLLQIVGIFATGDRSFSTRIDELLYGAKRR